MLDSKAHVPTTEDLVLAANSPALMRVLVTYGAPATSALELCLDRVLSDDVDDHVRLAWDLFEEGVRLNVKYVRFRQRVHDNHGVVLATHEAYSPMRKTWLAACVRSLA